MLRTDINIIAYSRPISGRDLSEVFKAAISDEDVRL